MGQAWRSQFTEEELVQIEATTADSIIGRMARLLDSMSPAIPDRHKLTQLDRLSDDQLGQVRRMDEGS